MEPSPNDIPSREPNPHAICQATGYIYQGVGLFLALGSCCWWSLSGRFQEEVRPGDKPPASVDPLADAPAHLVWTMLGTTATFAGGLALAALGLGLQHLRPASGAWAKRLTLAVALFFWVYFIAAVSVLPATVMGIIVPGLMALTWTALFLLAGASVETLRRHPPTVKPSESQWTARDEDDLRKA